MKINVIAILLGTLAGMALPVLEAAMHFAETAPLDQHLEPVSGLAIPDKVVFVQQLVIYGRLAVFVPGWPLKYWSGYFRKPNLANHINACINATPLPIIHLKQRQYKRAVYALSAIGETFS